MQKSPTDHRLLALTAVLAFFGGTLLLGELGCGQMFQTYGDRYSVPQDLPGAPRPQLLNDSENLRQIEDETERFWMNDQPSHLTFDRIHGGVRGGESENPKVAQGPTVWKRDRHRPSFARVYVGDGNSLELVSMDVRVTVDGPRARTVVDHVFRNPHDRQLEGTFEYPLPSGASPSSFVLYLSESRDAPPPRLPVREGPPLPLQRADAEKPAKPANDKGIDWGKPKEARVVAKDKALETYEDVVRTKVDPALLEYAGGNNFRGRVFPIPAKGHTRVVLTYEETLPVSGDDLLYRFALPDCKLNDLKLTLDAKVKEGKAHILKPGAKEWSVVQNGSGESFHFSTDWSAKGPGGEAVFTLRPGNATVQSIVGRQGESGPRYLYARVRPDFKAERAEPFGEHAVFLLDTSLSENPDRFNVSMKLMKQILQNDPDIKQFNVLTFDAAARWLEPRGWLDNTAAGREAVFARLDGVLLEGATDVSAALDKLCKPDFAVEPGTPLNVFLLSDGQITWGESDVAQLVAKFESHCPFPTRFHCYRNGLGADNAELFEALTRRGGGVFNCFGEGDLWAASQAHRYRCAEITSVRFKGGPILRDFLIAGRKAALYPGGELILAARVTDEQSFPEGPTTELTIEGWLANPGSKPSTFLETYTIELNSSSELAARAWGEVAVASLLSVNDPKLDPLVTAYCQEFSIVSRVASFLVLENESDYKRLNLEEERGKTVAGDLQSFLDGLWVNLGKPLSERAVFERFLAKTADKVKLYDGTDGKHVKRLLSLLEEADLKLPYAGPDAPLPNAKAVPSSYLNARKKDPRDVSLYIAEAKRRAELKVEPDTNLTWTECRLQDEANKQNDAGAVRALSSIVEMYPGRADALRLVGYRLLDLRQPAQAARLFRQVERDRPFEPHSYRDLARALEECGKYGPAAVQYEILLAGTWHSRFHDSLKVVAREEYAQMMQQAIRQKAVPPKLADLFGERLEGLSAAREPSDLRVSISWNTDATDVDLWVIEPDGTKVFYSNPRSPGGGELSQDQTQGYGPERYPIAKARGGEYRVIVHNFAANPNQLGGETHVHVVVTRHAGTPREVSERYNVILKKPKEQIEVTRVKF